MSAAVNPMAQLRVTKVCVNIGVGEGGERLINAENVLEMVTGVKPQRTLDASKTATSRSVLGCPLDARQPCASKKTSWNS